MADKAAKDGICSVITQSNIFSQRASFRIYPTMHERMYNMYHVIAPRQINCFQSNQYLAKTISKKLYLLYLLCLKNLISIRTSCLTIALFLIFLLYLKSFNVLLNLDLLNTYLPIISSIPTNLPTLSTTQLKLLCSTFMIISLML